MRDNFDKRRLWRGKVLKVIIDCPRLLDSVIIESLEEGYEKEDEAIRIQINAATCWQH
jgi:hypothetical protein